MNKPLKITLKLLKWLVILVCSFYFLAILIFGFTKVNTDGSRFYWSGLEALWKDDEEFAFRTNDRMKAEFDGVDGPYIIADTAYYVTSDNKIETLKINVSDTILVEVNNSSKDRFSFLLERQISKPQDVCEMPDKIVALSDIEGNFDGFSSFLMANKIMDADYNWIFGNGHLVLNGDFVDRGNNVVPVLWLIYKLEKQAESQGGKVHYILGNHEIMNFQGKWSYNDRRYIKASQTISKENDWDKAVRLMYSDETELGKWLRSKNVMEKIGNYIFVHAGLSPEILKYKVSVSDINRIARDNWDKDLYEEEENNKVKNFISGKKGIYWYRGLAMDYKYYPKITEKELNQVLAFYDADKIVFGHTVKDDITKEFNSKTINTDIKHGQEKNTGKTKGILIENGTEYKIDDKGNKQKL